MALLPESNSLKDLLTKHGLQNVYDSLLAQGYSIDLLSECSENDVEELCGVLKLDLIHRLRFKRCLKELNIPKSCNYTIITQNEQKVIQCIDTKSQTLQTLITTSNSDAQSTLHDQTIKQNKELIDSTFDRLIRFINQQRQQTFIALDNAYKLKQRQTKLIATCHDELKQIKSKCESLLIPNDPNVDFNARYQSMLDMMQQWSIKYQTLHQIDKIDITANPLHDIHQNIANVMNISPQKIPVLCSMHENDSLDRMDSMSSIHAQLDEKEMDIGADLPPNVSEREIISDTVDAVHDALVFQHRPLRAWRYDSEQEKWRGRGKGQLSIYYNDETQLSKLIFLDEKHNKTRLLQYVNGRATSSITEDGMTEIRWDAADYTMSVEDPLIGEWKIQFVEDNNDAAAEFTDVFNQYTQEAKDDKQQIVNGLFDWSPFVPYNNNNNNDVNEAKSVELKPIIHLNEQTVPSGHENETLLKSIEFRVLYVFGQDVAKAWDWKERARQSTICFYQCNASGRVRMVAREQDTNKLRLNHYVPSNEAIAKVKRRKTEAACSWNANDDTLDEELSIFCIRFGDANTALLFYQQFVSAMAQNHEIIEEEVSPNDENIKWFAFSFGGNGVNDDSKTEDCPICYEDPHADTALMTKCGHVFCEDCIKKSLENTKQCPMCRKECCMNDLKEVVKTAEASVEQIVVNTEQIESFVDTEQFNFGAFMKDIKGFVDDGDDYKQEDDIQENVSNITFKPIANLVEMEVETGHENETLLQSFEVVKVYRWGRDVSDQQCWKCRASNTVVQFYQHKESGKVRLVSREHCTNKLRLNHWIPPMDVAYLAKKTMLQVQWAACDATLLIEDQCTVKGFAFFAAKFRDVKSANDFFELFTNVGPCNAILSGRKDAIWEGGVQGIKDMVNDEEDVKDDGVHTKLEEHTITKLSIWDGENWKALVLDTKLEMYQATTNGMMVLICKGSDSKLILNHPIPLFELANVQKKADNEVEWTVPCKGQNSKFMATFQESVTADMFMGYFVAGSSNNLQIKRKTQLQI